MKITVLDGYGLNPGDMSWAPVEALGDVTVYDRTPVGMIAERAAGAEILLTNKTPLDAGTISNLPDLRYIGVLATGYNIVDTEAAAARGITVTNIPAYSTDSVAQLVFAHLLNIVCRADHYAQLNRTEGKWSSSPDFVYWDFPIHELAGMTFGIVGLGNIGLSVARIALAFGMRVKAFTSKAPGELPEGIESCPLDELFSTSDVVSLHCPLTPGTMHLADRRRLSLMRPSAILINTGRGQLIDEQALADALDAGRLYAAGLDVLSSEPPAPDNPLLKARNCFITPHIGWASAEARQRLMRITADNIRAWMDGRPCNAVN